MTMNRKQARLAIVAGVAVAGLALGATTVAAENSDTDVEDAEDRNEGPDIPITGADLDRASAVALEFTGEGQVTATEIEDEESYYEVEVTLDDGSEVDVQLDESFDVVGTD